MKRRDRFVRVTLVLFMTSHIMLALLWFPKICFPASVTLSWDESPDSDTAGYKLYYLANPVAAQSDGTVAPQWSDPVDVANVTTATINDLNPSTGYLFAVTAYNRDGAESSYSPVLQVSDVDPPQVTITSPVTATATGPSTICASASDNVGVTDVEFLVNDVLQATAVVAPYCFVWNASSLSSGLYNVTVKAYDAAGNIGRASVSLTLGGDTISPTADITAPANGATVNGNVTITASAKDDVGVTRVEIYDNGAQVFSTNQTLGTFSWNTTASANGAHTLFAKAYDAAGNVGQSGSVTVTVFNDTAAPVVTFLAPTASYVYGNSVTVSASATDDVKVAKMDLYIDGTFTTSTTSSTFSVPVNFTKGVHVLTVKATDSSNNVGTKSLTINRFF